MNTQQKINSLPKRKLTPSEIKQLCENIKHDCKICADRYEEYAYEFKWYSDKSEEYAYWSQVYSDRSKWYSDMSKKYAESCQCKRNE